MSNDRQENELTDEEIARRRDEALRRALATPPQPRKPTGKKGAIPKLNRGDKRTRDKASKR